MDSGSRQLHVDERLDPFYTNKRNIHKARAAFRTRVLFPSSQKDAKQVLSVDIMDDLKKASQIAYNQTAVIF